MFCKPNLQNDSLMDATENIRYGGDEHVYLGDIPFCSPSSWQFQAPRSHPIQHLRTDHVQHDPVTAEKAARKTFVTLSRQTHIVERATILSEHVELLAEGGKRTAVYRVRVRGAHDIRACGMDSGMDHECSLVEESVGARLRNLHGPMMVNEDEVFRLDKRKVLSLRQAE